MSQEFDYLCDGEINSHQGVVDREVGYSVLNLAKSYLNEQVGVHLHFWITDSEKYCIFLKRARVTGDTTALKQLNEMGIATPNESPFNNEDTHVEMPVFVNIAESMKSPEVRPIASVVRLQSLDDCLDPLRDPSEQGFLLTLELTGRAYKVRRLCTPLLSGDKVYPETLPPRFRFMQG